MPAGCGVPLCPNRNFKSAVVRRKNLQFHCLPREEPLRSAWCRSIGKENCEMADLRFCSEHFDGNQDYLRISSVLRDTGQTMRHVRLKPGAVPSLRLPPFAMTTPAKEPASKRPRILGDEPTEDVGCSEGNAPREHWCSCGPRPASRNAAVQADLDQVQVAPMLPAREDKAVGTDPRLGKKSVGTQGDSYARGITSHGVQTEELLGSSSNADNTTSVTSSTSATSAASTSSAASTASIASSASTSSVAPEEPVPAPATPISLEAADSPESTDLEDSSDPPYVPSNEWSFVEDHIVTNDVPLHEERKFLVFESSLRELFTTCKTCYAPCKVSTVVNATRLTVRTHCPDEHVHVWDSMPCINGRAAGALLLSAAILFTGASPAKTLRVLDLMNVEVFSEKTFYNYQRTVLLQAVAQVWADEQGHLMDKLRDQPLDLAGDGRCDSPGFSAKYLTYSLYAAHANKILHFEQIQLERY
ncbi:uncharacterized protein LOC121838545 [Ixodes scapularis]|uniref:uncharacterized protein LOC121838545 n=1 Tax=Ixodes scapularis TaxID=6945 RepID=UPI001C389FC0|nr:uncharacterized protein LOC121838545 [Ixodes scapularis]